MEAYRQRLEAKVKAVNTAHAIANEWHLKLREYFTQFVGKQIFKAAGGFLEKVKKGMPELPCDTKTHIYRRNSNYSLCFTVKTCEQWTEYGCLYYEVTFHVGELNDGVLTTISDAESNLRTDFTPEEIQQKRKAFETAKKAADIARSNLYPFGEIDN